MRCLLGIALLGLGACEGSPLERSCSGASVGLCAAYEHTVVTAASLEPERLTIADFTLTAHVHVEIGACPMAPSAPVVDLLALEPTTTPDGGSSVGVISLIQLRDGADGDAATGDGLIDVVVPNPFIATIAPDADIALRFVPRAGTAGCTGEALEVPYRTGPPR